MKIETLYNLFLQSNKIEFDTRKISKNDLFFGLTGIINGSKFAEQAINYGAFAAIVDDKQFENPEKNIFYVENSLDSLQKLANYHRKKLNIPIFALTGSNGKTTTKELIASVLKQKFNIQFTQGNLNNHIGVPLTILSINKNHNFAIIEMGANHQKEIELLCLITEPNIGYVTNFGKAHLEGFGGFEGVIKGKSEMYDFLRKNNKIALVNTDDDLQIENSKNIERIFFGKNTEFDFEPYFENQKIGLKYQNTKIQSNLTGTYNFMNLSAAVRLGLYFDIPIEKIKYGIEYYIPENHRSQIIQKNDYHIIMDSYNANPTSMQAALDNFILFEGSKTLIIGDMFEIGNDSKYEHNLILNHIKNKNFEQAIFIGEEFYSIKNTHFLFFKTKNDFLIYLKQNPIKNKNILIKGSRAMKLETILNEL